MTKAAKTVDAYLGRLPPPRLAVATALRELVRRAAPGLTETIKWGVPCYCGQGNVCGIMAHRDHVNLVFFRGAELADPEGLLEGTGKGMRHIKVPAPTDLRMSAVTALVKEAARLDSH